MEKGKRINYIAYRMGNNCKNGSGWVNIVMLGERENIIFRRVEMYGFWTPLLLISKDHLLWCVPEFLSASIRLNGIFFFSDSLLHGYSISFGCQFFRVDVQRLAIVIVTFWCRKRRREWGPQSEGSLSLQCVKKRARWRSVDSQQEYEETDQWRGAIYQWVGLKISPLAEEPTNQKVEPC